MLGSFIIVGPFHRASEVKAVYHSIYTIFCQFLSKTTFFALPSNIFKQEREISNLSFIGGYSRQKNKPTFSFVLNRFKECAFKWMMLRHKVSAGGNLIVQPSHVYRWPFQWHNWVESEWSLKYNFFCEGRDEIVIFCFLDVWSLL